MGGKGQQALIDARAVAGGAGTALEVAVAYLRGGGTPVEWNGVGRSFLIARAGEGGPQDRMRVEAGASSEAFQACTLQRAGTSFAVLLGGRAGRTELHWSDCPACHAAARRALDPVPDPHAVLTGAAAALVYQLHALGKSSRGEKVLPGFTDAEPLRCEAHR